MDPIAHRRRNGWEFSRPPITCVARFGAIVVRGGLRYASGLVLNVRLLMLAAPLLATSATMETARPTLPIPEFGVSEPRFDIVDIPSIAAPVVPPEQGPQIDLQEVTWTVESSMSLEQLASLWGVRQRQLAELNPALDRDEVPQGQRLVVFRQDGETPTQSLGAPNRGRLRRGIPLPEGKHWEVREHRGHVFGTRNTIEALLMAFQAYGEAHPDGPTVRLGDISARRGGRLFPHASHRTGRDVDIGYILTQRRTDRWWERATEETFDVEKNWTLIKGLIETGEVQRVFMSARLQRLLIERAKQELDDEELARWFRTANPDPSEPSIIRHWKGHRDHMHVRFACESGNRRCVRKSIGE